MRVLLQEMAFAFSKLATLLSGYCHSLGSHVLPQSIIPCYFSEFFPYNGIQHFVQGPLMTVGVLVV